MSDMVDILSAQLETAKLLLAESLESNQQLRKKELELLAAFHRNMLIAYPNKSHEEISEEIARVANSQTLREHEAKVLEEAAEWFATNHVVMLQKGLLHSEELRRMAEERRKKLRNNNG